jgi:hypothetical protein
MKGVIMNKFTDDDLARWKIECNYARSLDSDVDVFKIEEVKALLARLEAAERIVNKSCMNECGGCWCKDNRTAWRKVCGK